MMDGLTLKAGKGKLFLDGWKEEDLYGNPILLNFMIFIQTFF